MKVINNRLQDGCVVCQLFHERLIRVNRYRQKSIIGRARKSDTLARNIGDFDVIRYCFRDNFEDEVADMVTEIFFL